MKNGFSFVRSRLVSITGFLILAGAVLAASRGWVVYESPNSGQTNFLASVTAFSASDVWAVGYAYDANSQQVVIMQHWNGANWSTATSPNPGTAQECGETFYDGNELAGLHAIAADDVWAVGNICGPGTAKTLAMHWDGNGWDVVPSPNNSLLDGSELSSVSAVSRNDVWAAGNYQVAFQYQWETLIEHWDGTAWSIVPSPNPVDSQITYLTAVSALAANDVWAVGYSHGGARPLIEHWNGTGWSIVPAPSAVRSYFNVLYAVKAIAPNDAWAVGYQNANGDGQNGQGLILHWNGTAWTTVENPIAGYATILLGVAANSSDDVNAVGYIQTRNVQYEPVTEHWNGFRWAVVKAATPGRVGQLWGAAASNGSTWAVGAYSLLPMTQGFMKNPATLTLKSR